MMQIGDIVFRKMDGENDDQMVVTRQDMGTGLGYNGIGIGNVGVTGVSTNYMRTNSIIFRKSFASTDRPESCSLSSSRGRQTRPGTGWTTTSPWSRTMRTK